MKLYNVSFKLLAVGLCLVSASFALADRTSKGATRNAQDIAVIDQALAQARPGEQVIPFGDVGLAVWQLKVFRSRLVAEQSGVKVVNPVTDAATPPGTAFKWPAGIVPFRFDSTQTGNGTITAAKQQQFRDSVAEWAAFANLQFNEFTGATPTNFITVQEDSGLGEGGFSSSVGMKGGEQFIKLAPDSWNRGTICHEVGHALGLYHEQQRDDRDTYVIIDTNNISAANRPNFDKLPGGTNEVGDYDFFSVMHYSRNALAINPAMDTISMQSHFVQFADIIGRVFYRTLSKLDRAGMAAIYGPPPVAPSAIVTNTKDSGTGSLRSALYFAFDRSTDSPPSAPTVSFQIPKSDSGFASKVFTIKPTYLMVAPGAGTTIDGATQTAFTGDTNTAGPEIVLSGAQFPAQGAFAPGFLVLDASCVIKNLVINGFNREGIYLDGAGATGDTVSGCYIGTNSAGAAAVGNSFPGVEIAEGANNNTIGGNTTAARNVISGNLESGVSIHDDGTDNNVIAGNFIGTKATGNATLPNSFQGIILFGGTQGNVIGGTVAGARNIISGNDSDGIAFFDAGTTSNVVEGNYIGLNSAGKTALPNTGAGLSLVAGAASNTIGSSTDSGGRNVISGNSGAGVVIENNGTNSNQVLGNIIGMNPAGTVSLGNQGSGIDIFASASSNVIGGTPNLAKNFISGNSGAGVNISGAGTKSNKVLHNFIGTKLNGTAAIPNNAGVQIFGGAQSNTIGGTAANARNIISGNNFQGVAISGTGTDLNTVSGNYIGTNKTGAAALPNTGAGVSLFLGAQSNTIGGTKAMARNVISGNKNQGVTISDSGTSSNKIVLNFIGTNAAGTGALGNGFSGIDIFTGASSNIIGALGQGNVISGNGNYGIAISGTGTSAQSVRGNLIGLNAAGTAGIGNSFSGIALFNGAQNNLIGSSAAGAGNSIAFNAFDGISVYDSSTTGNDFNANSIFSNSGLGINLVGGNENGFGVTANDNKDPDSGPNSLQNYPVLTSANSSAVIQGSLNSLPNKSYRIDFYSSPSADPSGFGEGQVWIGATSVTTNSSGSSTFNIDFPGSLASGSKVSATATGTAVPSDGTSEFSAAITVSP